MPVKWDPGMDQLLLLKILETHDLKVDVKKISASWPDDRGEKPTPRAITERLVKIRSNARTSGAGNFGISSSQLKGNSPSKTSPAKPTTSTSKPANMNALKSTPTKRKKTNGVDIKLESDDDDIEIIDQTITPTKQFRSRIASGHSLAELANHPISLNTPTKSMNRLSVGNALEDEDEEVGSPSKRPRRASANRDAPYGSDGDVGADSDTSVYYGGVDVDGLHDEEENAV